MKEERKQLAGKITFTKPAYKVWEDAHGDKRCQVKLEILGDYSTIAKISSLSQTIFSADVFELENETFGGQEA